MIKNVGLIDKVLRVLLAVTVFILIAFKQVDGIAAIVLGVFAVVFILTSFVGVCPLYIPFKISTVKKEKK